MDRWIDVGMYVCMSDFLVFALRSRIVYPRMAEWGSYLTVVVREVK